MKITLGGKDPIKPTVEAIESMQRNIDYWGRRCERLEAALQKIADHTRGGCLGFDADQMIDIARDALNKLTGGEK